MRTTTRAALAAAATSLLATAAAAQQEAARPLPTVIEGLTVDAQSGLPFPNVQVRFDTGQRITSDEEGRYTLADVPPGHHRVAIVTGRCNVSFAAVDLAPGEIKRVAFAVPSEMVGQGPTAEEMKKRSEGAWYSGEELQEMNARNLLETLRRVAPDMVGPPGGQPGVGASLQGRTRTAQGVNPPLVVLDEVVVGDGMRVLRDLKAQDVASLEVLRGASRGWAYGTGGAGGVIKVVTRSGDLGYGVLHPDRCEIGPWVEPGGGTGLGRAP